MIKVFFKAIDKLVELNFGLKVIGIENASYFRNIYYNPDEQLIISYDNKELTSGITKLENPLAIDINNKKSLTILYKLITTKIQREHAAEFATVMNSLTKILEEVSDNQDIQINYGSECSIEKLLQSMNVEYLQTSEYLDELIGFLRNDVSVNKTKLFLTFNLNNIVSGAEFELLNKELELNEITVLDISLLHSKNESKDEPLMHLDSDLCII